ncbi:DUF6883 domain-containing protein [Methylobacterium sp. MA0201]|uniref:DUF6883 domain-containing protein n=1 Tax=Methylobacterium alsaeris TaxID=3344826 RepID=UPI003757C176
MYCYLEKVTRYLMSDLQHVDGRGKRAFFEAHGFHRDDPVALVRALEDHGTSHPIVEHWRDEWGERWEVLGELSTPSGRRPVVRTAWILRPGEVTPSLVTAMPG